MKIRNDGLKEFCILNTPNEKSRIFSLDLVSVSGLAGSCSITFGLPLGYPKSLRTAKAFAYYPEALQAITGWHLIYRIPSPWMLLLISSL